MMLDLQKELDPKNVHQLLLGAITPRPIAFASTVDKEGKVNLSPFSFFNVFSAQPAVLVFSPSRRGRDNTTKHTLENILEVPEVVINTVNFQIVEQVSLASTEYPKGVNEFVKAGFTEVKSLRVKPPRVKESPVSLECKVLEVKSLGTKGGAGNLVICEVLVVHANDELFDAGGRIDPWRLDAVGRLGGDYYCRVSGESIISVARPVTTIGIGIDRLPEEIRNSPVLTGNDLGRLANIEAIPSREEANTFAKQHGYGVEGQSDSQAAVHTRVREYLSRGDVKSAWLVLLSTGEES